MHDYKTIIKVDIQYIVETLLNLGLVKKWKLNTVISTGYGNNRSILKTDMHMLYKVYVKIADNEQAVNNS